MIWYDFGMMSEIAPYTKDRLLQLFYAIAQQDADAVIKSLTDLGIIVPTSDTLSLKRAISFFLDNVNKQAQKEETLSAIGESCKILSPFEYLKTFCLFGLFLILIWHFQNLKLVTQNLFPKY